jgi:selenocysteine lyase/cysteine desulfurase
MLVNNEIGVIQPVGEIARLAHEAGAVMLCDAVQGLGRVAIPEGPDLVAVSAHKVHGPKGIGALWIRKGSRTGAPDPRRRPGAGDSLGHSVAGAVRRLRGRSEAGVRSAATPTANMSSGCGARRSMRWDKAGSSTAASSIAIAAISTSAASASIPAG